MDPARRVRVLIAVIASISVVGLSLGFTIPLVSLVLESRGVPGGQIGALAAVPAVAVLLGSMLIPALVRRIGARSTMYAAMVVSAGSIALLPVFDDLAAWYVLRFAMGAANGALFTISETWINQVVEDHRRGTLVAVYGTVFSACMAAGPALITWVGIEGATPFWMAATVLATAALPVLLLGEGAPVVEGRPSFNVAGFFRRAPYLAGAVMLFAFLDGASLSILPVFGLRHGFSAADAALMVSVLIAGNIALQLPIGAMADRVDRHMLLRLCTLTMLLCAALLAPAALWGAWVWPVLFLLGATAGGIYTLAIILVGQRFTGADLVAANAALGVSWGLGSLMGPAGSGLAVQWLGANGLPLILVIATLVYCGVLIRGRAKPA